jgi:hypothetical protein
MLYPNIFDKQERKKNSTDYASKKLKPRHTLGEESGAHYSCTGGGNLTLFAA